MAKASLVIVTGIAMASPSGKIPPTHRGIASPVDLIRRSWHYLLPISGRTALGEKCSDSDVII